MQIRRKVKRLIAEHYTLIAILAGALLVSLSIGPFENPDTTWEYKATAGVLQWGIPYTEVFGSLMNQPPLGFYLQGLFLKVFGPSMNTGVVLVTLLGLCSALVLYKIGKELYGKTTGLFAAALFAFAPWQLVLSRAFLIDAPCLFFSLLCLYFGLLAVRRGSVKLSLISGVFFAAALLTKLFAVFVLIPLALFFIYYGYKKPRRMLLQLLVFCLPVLFFNFLWYQVVLNRGVFYAFGHSDFSDPNAAGVVPTPFFVGTFLVDDALGWLFLVAVAFSLLATVGRKRLFKEAAQFDWICLATIIIIVATDVVLGAVFNLKVPYTSAIKYTYQAMPFFCLLAASLAYKSTLLLREAKVTVSKSSFSILLSGVAVLLITAVLVWDFAAAHQLSVNNFVLFQVKPPSLLGYSFDNFHSIGEGNALMYLQYLGFALTSSGLLWMVRQPLRVFAEKLKSRYEAEFGVSLKPPHEL